MVVTAPVVWNVVLVVLMVVVLVTLVPVPVVVYVVKDVLVALTVITTVGLVVIKALSPDRDGTRLISSVIKVLISDKEICSRAALPSSARLSASPSPMDAGKMMT